MRFPHELLRKRRALFARLAFQKQMILSFTILTFSLICLVGGASISAFFSFAQGEMEKNAEQNVAFLNQNVEKLVTDALSSFSVSKNYSVSDFLRSSHSGNDYRRAYEVGTVIANWRMLQSEDSPLVDVTIISINGYGYSERNGYFVSEAGLMSHPDYQELLKNPRRTYIWGSPAPLKSMPWEQDIFCLATGLFRTGTNELAGIIRVSIPKSYLTRTLYESRYSENSRVLVYDRAGTMIFSDREYKSLPFAPWEIRDILQGQEQSGMQTRRLGGVSNVLVYRPLAAVDWLVVSAVPSMELLAPMLTMLEMLLVVLLLAIALGVSLNSQLSSSISRPLNELATHISHFAEGNLEPIEQINGGPEVQDLVRIFNCMVVDIRLLMNQITQEQETLKRSELKALQAQINPHFLYNSMDSAVWAAENGETTAVIDLLTSLAKFYRLALSGGMDIIPFFVEVGHVTSYLEVVHMRYQDIFTYELDISPETKGCLFPKIILQPLVENALYHGVKEYRYPTGQLGHIRVRAACKNGFLHIEVQDNGKGMTEDEQRRLLEKIKTENVSHEESYGLKSVHQRLQLYFGAAYEMKLCSAPGEGMCMELVVPIRTEQEEV